MSLSAPPASILAPDLRHNDTAPMFRGIGFISVIALHVLAIAGLAKLVLQTPSPSPEPEAITVTWQPTTTTPPQPETPQPPKPEPLKTQPPPTPAQPLKPTTVPQPVPTTPVTKTATPQSEQLIHAPADTNTTAPATAPAAVVPPPAPSTTTQQTTNTTAQASNAAPSSNKSNEIDPKVDCVQSPKPSYPVASLKLAEEGAVRLHVQADENGFPLQVNIDKSSGYPRLDRAARDTVKQSWQCPMRQGKKAQAGWFYVPINFTLP